MEGWKVKRKGEGGRMQASRRGGKNGVSAWGRKKSDKILTLGCKKTKIKHI
jgi:hypothetical protein